MNQHKEKSEEKKDPSQKKGLEETLTEKIQPAITMIMQKFMGFRIHELGTDITEKLTKNPLLGFSIDTNETYREAKKKFRKEYIVKLLLKTYGNISEAARIAEIERRSIHRFINETRLNVQKMRKDMIRPQYIREMAVEKELLSTFKDYEQALHPQKMQKIYHDISEITKDILKEIPDEPMSLKDAENEFTLQYFTKLAQTVRTIKEIAKKSGLRYESAHRKLTKLNIQVQHNKNRQHKQPT